MLRNLQKYCYLIPLIVLLGLTVFKTYLYVYTSGTILPKEHMNHETGNAYTIDITSIVSFYVSFDSLHDGYSSVLNVYEDGKLLGSPHSSHDGF